MRRTTINRHVRGASGCREFRDQVRGQRRSLGALLPVLPSLALRDSLWAAISGGTATGGAAVSSGGATLAAKVLVVVAVAGGSTAAGVEAVRQVAAARAEAGPDRRGRASGGRAHRTVHAHRKRAGRAHHGARARLRGCAGPRPGCCGTGRDGDPAGGEPCGTPGPWGRRSRRRLARGYAPRRAQRHPRPCPPR
jgi:hypothetical protein